MSSHFSGSRDQQQQHAMFMDPCVPRSTASTSRMRPNNGMASQRGSSGFPGGSRSEPLRPRPSYPAPSTVYPDDSASLQESQVSSNRSTQRGVSQFNTNPNCGPRDAPYSIGPRGSQNQYAPPSFRSTPQSNMSGASRSQLRTPSSNLQQAPSFFDVVTTTGNHTQGAPSQRSGRAAPDYEPLPSVFGQDYPDDYEPLPSMFGQDYPDDYEPLPSMFGPSAPSNVRGTAAPSTARSANRPSSGMVQSSTRGSAARSGTGVSTGQMSQIRAAAPSASHLSPGINIGVPLGAQMHFHYNQVDNRQVHIRNNAPQNVVTHNNQNYTTDNSNHHNTHAPQANAYHTHATNVGNTYTQVSQKARTAGTSSNRAPSETIHIRDRLYKRASHKDVPNDRPC